MIGVLLQVGGVRRVGRDRVQAHQVVGEDRHEERGLTFQLRHGEVGHRRGGRFLRAHQVARIAGRLVEQHLGAEHRPLVVDPHGSVDRARQVDVVGVQAAAFAQAQPYPVVHAFGPPQVVAAAGDLVELDAELRPRRVADRVALELPPAPHPPNAPRAGVARVAVPAADNQAEGFHRLGQQCTVAEHAKRAQQLQSHPLVVVVELFRAPRRERAALIAGRLGSPVPVRAQAAQVFAHRAAVLAPERRDARDRGGGGQRLAERPQKGVFLRAFRFFAPIQVVVGHVELLLHGRVGAQRAFGVHCSLSPGATRADEHPQRGREHGGGDQAGHARRGGARRTRKANAPAPGGPPAAGWAKQLRACRRGAHLLSLQGELGAAASVRSRRSQPAWAVGLSGGAARANRWIPQATHASSTTSRAPAAGRVKLTKYEWVATWKPSQTTM